MSSEPAREVDYDETIFLHPACPECIWGSIYLTGDRDALICSNCPTIFLPDLDDKKSESVPK